MNTNHYVDDLKFRIYQLATQTNEASMMIQLYLHEEDYKQVQVWEKVGDELIAELETLLFIYTTLYVKQD